eukprot:Awhi_evm1s8916
MARPRNPNQKFEISKNEIYGIDPSIRTLNVGFGWDSKLEEQNLLFSFYLYDKDQNTIEYKHGMGLNDNSFFPKTGTGDDDDETCKIDLYKLPKNVEYISCDVALGWITEDGKIKTPT